MSLKEALEQIKAENERKKAAEQAADLTRKNDIATLNEQFEAVFRDVVMPQLREAAADIQKAGFVAVADGEAGKNDDKQTIWFSATLRLGQKPARPNELISGLTIKRQGLRSQTLEVTLKRGSKERQFAVPIQDVTPEAVAQWIEECAKLVLAI